VVTLEEEYEEEEEQSEEEEEDDYTATTPKYVTSEANSPGTNGTTESPWSNHAKRLAQPKVVANGGTVRPHPLSIQIVIIRRGKRMGRKHQSEE
jgi:hypothetical protein